MYDQKGIFHADFAPDVRWIQERIRADYKALPAAVQGVAQYYLTQRIKVLHDRDPVCSALSIFAPADTVFGFLVRACDFGLEDVQVRRLLGLSLVYVCLSVSPRDDLLDGSGFAPHQQTYLARWFW